MPEVELSGTIEYQDTGGDGPVLMFLPGLTMDQPEQLIRAIRGFVPAARRNTPLPNNAPIRPALRADRGR